MSTARFNPRDPLTLHTARTVRETRRDPYDYWTTAEAAIAEEEHIRKMFADQHKQAVALNWKWGVRVMYVVAAGVALAFAFGWFK